jgi:large conductance mechanosensitive channel
MLKEFRAFLLRGNVVDLAVAVVIGAAFKSVVDAFVAGIITPLIGMVFAKDFSEMTFVINDSTFFYGTVITQLISFVAIAAVIFFLVVKPMQALAERRRRGEPTDDTPAPSDEALLLTEIRDLLAARS